MNNVNKAECTSKDFFLYLTGLRDKGSHILYNMFTLTIRSVVPTATLKQRRRRRAFIHKLTYLNLALHQHPPSLTEWMLWMDTDNTLAGWVVCLAYSCISVGQIRRATRCDATERAETESAGRISKRWCRSKHLT